MGGRERGREGEERRKTGRDEKRKKRETRREGGRKGRKEMEERVREGEGRVGGQRVREVKIYMHI